MWCCFVVFVCLCLVWICFWCGVLLFGGVCLVVSLALLTRPWVPKYGSYYGRLNGCHYRHDERSVGSKKIVTCVHWWARACFEQGSFPSLMAIPGDASPIILPGDRMFQAQRIVSGKCRPVILHGYGGRKRSMPAGLASSGSAGWLCFSNGWICSWPPIVDRGMTGIG